MNLNNLQYMILNLFFSDRLAIVYIFNYQLPFPANFCVEKTVFENKNLPTMGRVRTKTVKKAARVIIEK